MSAMTMTVRPATIKAVGDASTKTNLAEGQFRALVSAFGNVDSYGEVVMPGAFTDTLKTWEESGDPIPVVWSHKWDDPFSHIGHVIEAKESADGLEILAQLDVVDNPTAAQVHRLMVAGRIKQFSFAYDVDDGAWGERSKAGDDDEDATTTEVFELRKLTLHEVGPCLVGVNRATELRDIKSLIRDEIADQLKTTGATAPAQGNTSQEQEPRDDDPAPHAGKSDPPRLSPASVHALIDTQLPEGV